MYLVSIAVANKVKDKFYSEDLPNLEDVRDFALSFQFAPVNSLTTTRVSVSDIHFNFETLLGATISEELQTRLVENCTNVLLQAQTIQLSHQEVLKDRLASVTAALDGIQPHGDQSLFIDLNIRPFNLPSDWNFEPCTSHYDTVGYRILSAALAS